MNLTMKQSQELTGRTEKVHWEEQVKLTQRSNTKLLYPHCSTLRTKWLVGGKVRKVTAQVYLCEGFRVKSQDLCSTWWNWNLSTPLWHLQMFMRITGNSQQVRIRRELGSVYTWGHGWASSAIGKRIHTKSESQLISGWMLSATD